MVASRIASNRLNGGHVTEMRVTLFASRCQTLAFGRFR
jgi:hypothetical protein